MANVGSSPMMDRIRQFNLGMVNWIWISLRGGW
jgi:hypothetical protein